MKLIKLDLNFNEDVSQCQITISTEFDKSDVGLSNIDIVLRALKKARKEALELQKVN